MRYDEVLCQICGVSFFIARLRTVNEPPDAAWDYAGEGFIEFDEHDGEQAECGSDTGCTFVRRAVTVNREAREHIAGPGCISTAGYSGYRITLEEMKGSRVVQCLAKKKESWQPEHDDQDFELKSDYFLTGQGEGSPDSELLRDIKPIRHGVEQTYINNSPVSTINGVLTRWLLSGL